MAEIQHKNNIGSVILGLLNGLKHTPQTIGPLLNIAPEELVKVIKGEAELTKEMESALISVTGINQRDFYPAKAWHLFPVVDDTKNGVIIFHNEDTIKSQRMLTRGPQKTPYYVYADTAMSNISSFRPEWIKQLYVHDGGSADDLPDWAFNKGHLEHQVTYFIGSVNFHWKDKNGKKYVRKMNTGDINYIVPFVPHSFTTRKEEEGLILAVTYGGAIARQDFRSKISLLDMNRYLKLVKQHSGFYLDVGRHGVDIFPLSDRGSTGENYGFRFMNLVILGYQSFSEICSVELRSSMSSCGDHEQSERWGYNIGDCPVTLRCGEGSRFVEHLLESGDSFLIRPEIPHEFVATEEGSGKLLQVIIKSQQGDPFSELGMIDKYAGEEGLKRVHTETTRWY